MPETVDLGFSPGERVMSKSGQCSDVPRENRAVPGTVRAVGCRESPVDCGVNPALAVSKRQDTDAKPAEHPAVGQAPPPCVPIASRLGLGTGKDSWTFMGRGERADHDRWGDAGTPTSSRCNHARNSKPRNGGKQ